MKSHEICRTTCWRFSRNCVSERNRLSLAASLSAFPREGPGRSVGRTLRQCLQGQRNLADEPLVAPIKMNFAPELANYVFHNPCAKPGVCRWRDRRPARLSPTQTEPSVCRAGPCDFNVTTRFRQRSVFRRVGRELVQGDCNHLSPVRLQHYLRAVNLHADFSVRAVRQKLLRDQAVKVRLPPSVIARTAYGPLPAH
jgi:hypothetical protein